MATVRVSNESELMSALNKATGDTTILLASGNYDNLYISGNKIKALSNNSTVTLKSENPNNPATITKLEMIGVKNMVFDGLTFDYSAANGANVSTRPFMFLSSDNITIKNSVFDGDQAKGGKSYENGYGTGIAIGTKGVDNLTVQNNTFYDFHKGVVIENSDNAKVLNNDISGMSSDGVNFTGINNGVISGNYIHDFQSAANTTAHKDMIQIWSIGGSGQPSKNITIKDNFLNSGSGTYTQSILIQAENNKTHQDFTIENNLIHNAFTHGIAVSEINGLSINNNTILHNTYTKDTDSSQLYVPKIIVSSNISNAKVNDNVVHSIFGTSWSGSGNLIVQNTNPNQSNYYDKLFINALSGSAATAADLAPLPGGQIATSGIGSTIGQSGNSSAVTSNSSSSGSSGSSALLLSKEGTELSKGTVDFDISKITDNGKTVSTNGAKVQWDYGDGSTGSGLTSSHHYDHAGAYTVKATITLSNGKKIVETKKINVDTPLALASDFQQGAGDQSDWVNAVSTKGAVAFVNDQGSKVARLGDNGYITYKRGAELLDNTAYTVLVDYRKDNRSDDGKVISFKDSFVIQVKKDMLSVSVTTDKGGTKWINTKAPVDDTNWHKIALTFSSSTGRADLYLDGKVIGSITGLKGAVQVGNDRHDFHVGSHTGGSFDGLIDNVNFITGDLSAAEIKSLHNGSTTVSNILGSSLNSAGSGSTTTGTSNPTTSSGTTSSDPTGSNSGSNSGSSSNSGSNSNSSSSSNSSSNSNTGGSGSNSVNPSGTAIDVDFQSGYGDGSATVNAVSTKGANIVSYGGSKVLRLNSDKSVVTYKDTPDLFGNKAYTLLADFRKDNLSDSGKVISFADSFVIQVKKDMVSVSVTTDKGTKWLHKSANVNDTKMHNIALTFDSGAGKAEVFLDGKSLGTITGLKGAVQVGNKSQDFHIGSPWGGSFDGMVDNVMFLTDSLSAAEVRAIHNGSASIGSTSGSSGSTGSSGSSGASTGTTTTTTAAPTNNTNKNTNKVTVAEAIDVDFQSGYGDGSATVNAVSTKGANIVSYGGSKVLRLNSDKSVVTYKDTPDLFGNKAYTLLADFRKDNLSDDGKLITFAGSFVVQVKKDMLSVSVTTDKGTKWLHKAANIDDTKMHKVALTFDSGTGKAELFLDGKSLGAITGLKGAVQVGNKSHDFHIGSPWGSSFDGMVDNVMFLTDSLSAAEVRAIHNGSASVASVSASSGSSGSSGSSVSGTTNAAGNFSYTMTANKTKVVLDKAFKPGIIDQAYLSGDTAKAFNVKVIDTASSVSSFNNTLGVYEINSKGQIVDVRILDKDAQTGGDFKVTGVNKGNDLGFFIVQDGYNRLDNGVLNSKNLSLVVKSGDIHLKSGSKVLNDKVFVSHNKNLNVDNFQHVASMDNPNSNGAIIAFEDQYKGGRANDTSDVVFEVTAIGADELSFA